MDRYATIGFTNADIEAYRDLIEIPSDADEDDIAVELGETAEEQLLRYRQQVEDMMMD